MLLQVYQLFSILKEIWTVRCPFRIPSGQTTQLCITKRTMHKWLPRQSNMSVINRVNGFSPHYQKTMFVLLWLCVYSIYLQSPQWVDTVTRRCRGTSKHLTSPTNTVKAKSLRHLKKKILSAQTSKTHATNYHHHSTNKFSRHKPKYSGGSDIPKCLLSHPQYGEVWKTWCSFEVGEDLNEDSKEGLIQYYLHQGFEHKGMVWWHIWVNGRRLGLG